MQDRMLLYVDFNDLDRRMDRIPLSKLAAKGWTVYRAKELDEAQRLLSEQPIYVGIMCFLGEDIPSFRRWAQQLQRIKPFSQWVALLSSADISDDSAREDLFTFFYDYHTFPVDFTRLQVTLGHAYGMALMGERALSTEEEDAAQWRMLGTSKPILDVAEQIHRIATVNAPVLITGERGAGKEIAAHEIHRQSSRAHGPFVALNCASLPAHLIGPELFGHESSGVGGAPQTTSGRIESADGGTLFLDDIEDLPLDLQRSLLTVLEEGEIKPFGGSSSRGVNVRFIAASSTDLMQAVQEQRFLQNLYDHLGMLHLEIPPLRERIEDIELLARFFLSQFSFETSIEIAGFSEQSIEIMKKHDWPGNIRELINRVRRAIVMCENRLITPGDLGLAIRRRSQSGMTLLEARAAAEKEVISSCLETTSYNVSEAARRLKVARGTLYKLMERHGIQPPPDD